MSTREDENNHVKICVIFGPRIPPTQRRALFLLLAIVSLQRFFYYNSQPLLSGMLGYAIDSFHNEYSFPLAVQIPLIFTSLFGLFCDKLKLNRGRLVLFSLVMYLLSSISLLIGTGIAFYWFEKYEYVPINGMTSPFMYSIQTFLLLSLVLLVVATVIFLPISLVYGLDLLHDASPAASFLYLALSYLAFNFASMFAYLTFVSFKPEANIYHAIVMFVVMLLAVMLFSIGRYVKWLDDSIVVKSEYSFCLGIVAFCQAIARLFTCNRHKIPNNLSFLHLASKRFGGSFDPGLILMLESMVILHISLFLLLPFFGLFFADLVLFTQQSKRLFQPGIISFQNSTCHKGHLEYTYFSSISFVDSLTILLFLPLFEFVFYDVTFGYKKDTLPWFVRCFSSKYLCLRVLRSNLIQARIRVCSYFSSVDTIMKRMYWGLSFAILGVSASLIVEILQIRSDKENVTCINTIGNYSGQDYVSTLSVFFQIPQYIFFAIFECITMVGSFQFIFYQCSSYFGSSLNGFFFGLYFSYLALSETFFAGFFWLVGSFCRDKDCKHCYTHNNHCINYHNLTKTWVIWVVILVVLFALVLTYFFIVHYRNWKYSRAAAQTIHQEGRDLSQQLLIHKNDNRTKD